jgi:hypothetical protein
MQSKSKILLNREVTVSTSYHCFLVEFVGVALGRQLKLSGFGFLTGIHQISIDAVVVVVKTLKRGVVSYIEGSVRAFQKGWFQMY